MIATDLDGFLARHERVSLTTARWGDQIELAISGYLSSEAPPLDLVSQVRAIVLRDDRVLVMRNRDGDHILPGGRVEQGETLDETLRRELLEEAGATIEVIEQIGFVHLRHTTPKPKNYPYPYPDFLWPVCVASCVDWNSDAKVKDNYDVSSRFMPLLQAGRLVSADGYEKAFLEAAIAARS